jgi:hypothetical protein
LAKKNNLKFYKIAVPYTLTSFNVIMVTVSSLTLKFLLLSGNLIFESVNIIALFVSVITLTGIRSRFFMQFL